MTTSLPHLHVTTVGDARVVELTCADMTDAALIKTVGDEIFRLVKDASGPKVVVDFGRVERLSSATLGMLVALKKVVVDKQHGQLRLTGVRDHLTDIFRMTKLDKVLKLHESQQAAIESFK